MLDGLDRGLSHLTREVSAVTGACLLIPNGCLHRLDYLAAETRYRSVKFACAARSGAILPLVTAAGHVRQLYRFTAEQTLTVNTTALPTGFSQ